MASFKSFLVIVVLLLVKSSWSAPEQQRGDYGTPTESTTVEKDVGAGVVTENNNEKLYVSGKREDYENNSYFSSGNSENDQSTFQKDFSLNSDVDESSNTSGYINKSNEDKVDAGSTISVTNNDYSNVNHGSGVNHYKKWYDLNKITDVCTLSAGELAVNDFMYWGSQVVDTDSVNHGTSVNVESKDYDNANLNDFRNLNAKANVMDKVDDNSNDYKGQYVSDGDSDSSSTKEMGLMRKDSDKTSGAVYQKNDEVETDSSNNGGSSYATGGGEYV